MEKPINAILRILQDLKGSGQFVSSGTTDFVLPGLSIQNIGEIAFPIHADQIKKIIQHARQAPFGKGSETLVDISVRNTWEIDADEVTTNNPAWSALLHKVIKNVKKELGIPDNTIRAEIHKFLIYEEGGHFARHKDTEKGKDMFGSLIIYLPSEYTGGELVVEFEKDEVVVDFSRISPYEIGYAAFYADCDHEVKPVRSGYRVCLTYNLYLDKSEHKVDLVSVRNASIGVERALKASTENHPHSPVIVLLDHQYTPANFSINHLKLNDRLKAEVLLRAAETTGTYARLCLVTSYEMGSPAYDGYGYDGNDYDDEIDEVYDSSVSIEFWAGHELPGLNEVPYVEDDLLPQINSEFDEPIEKENSGYMGNYGPEIEHWYHYGAVMIWTKDASARMLPMQSTEVKLNWIGYFNGKKEISEQERAAVRSIILTGHEDLYRQWEFPNEYVVLEWMMVFDESNLLFQMDNRVLKYYFTAIDSSNWIRIIKTWPTENARELISKIAESADLRILERWIALTVYMSYEKSMDHLVKTYVGDFPGRIRSLSTNSTDRINKETISNFIELERSGALSDQDIEKLAESIFLIPIWKNIHQEVAPVLKDASHKSRLSDELRKHALNYLRRRVADKPQPPVDWSRAVPEDGSYQSYWEILRPFLESPTERVFDFKRNQNERNNMKQAIKKVPIDLEMQTIRQGSPHTLRLTKTQDEYERHMKIWRQDGALFEGLEE